jgi:hypothetical protein
LLPAFHSSIPTISIQETICKVHVGILLL